MLKGQHIPSWGDERGEKEMSSGGEGIQKQRELAWQIHSSSSACVFGLNKLVRMHGREINMVMIDRFHSRLSLYLSVRVPLGTPVLQRYAECTKYTDTHCFHKVNGSAE